MPAVATVLIPARAAAFVEECADVAAHRGLHSLEQQRAGELIVRLEHVVQLLGQVLLSSSAAAVIRLHEVCCELLYALHVDWADVIDLERAHAGLPVARAPAESQRQRRGGYCRSSAALPQHCIFCPTNAQALRVQQTAASDRTATAIVCQIRVGAAPWVGGVVGQQDSLVPLWLPLGSPSFPISTGAVECLERRVPAHLCRRNTLSY
eukprot:scaffold59752_cov63-Phaeocystis_antarctica.AAC.4